MAHIYDFRLVNYGFRVVISGIFKSGTYDSSVVIYDSRAFNIPQGYVFKIAQNMSNSWASNCSIKLPMLDSNPGSLVSEATAL